MNILGEDKISGEARTEGAKRPSIESEPRAPEPEPKAKPKIKRGRGPGEGAR